MNTVITGAGKGIGRATALEFAKNGSNLFLCSRTLSDLENLKQEILEKHSELDVQIAVCDVRDNSQIRAFGESIKEKWDRLDILINNAGVFLPGQIHAEDDGVLEMQIETNLYSAYHLTRSLMPFFLDQASGHIFNLCSIASFMAYPNGGSYSISKFALLGFSKVLRAEMQDKGVKVTAVMPGATWSNSWAGVELPEERLMQSEDIARTIWDATQLSNSAVIEEIILRPQQGDL